MTAKRWTVMRWSSRNCDAPRKLFVGTEEKARAKYGKLYREMRLGMVGLLDGEGKTIDRAWAPRLRTKW